MNFLDIGFLGLDFGSYKSILSICRGKGTLEVILNESSNRETHNIVAFTEKETSIGDQAFMKLKSNFKNTILSPLRFINPSLRINEGLLKNEIKWQGALLNLDEGNIKFEVSYLSKKNFFDPVQIIAMLIEFFSQKIKKSKSNYMEYNFVISIPSDFTQEERVLLNKCAEISSINLIKLVNESTVIGCLYKKIHDEELQIQGKKILFIDVGFSKTGMYLLNFNADNIIIIHESYDRFLGVRDIDDLLWQFYLKIIGKEKPNFQETPKHKIRVLEAIEKQRKILSANTEANLMIESLYEDYDLSYTMTRKEYEQIISPFLEKMKALFLRFKIEGEIFNKNLEFNEIEIIGGGIRIPIIQKLIMDIFETPNLSKTLNSTECFALGSALYCGKAAGISINMNLTMINEINFYTIYYSLKNKLESEIIVFNKGISFPCTTNLVIPWDENAGLIQFFYKIDDNKRILYELKMPDKSFSPETVPLITIQASLNDDGVLIIKEMKVNENKHKLLFEKDLLKTIPDETLKLYISKHKEIEKLNKIMLETYEMKNQIEAYIYSKRGELLEKYKGLLSEVTIAEVQKIFDDYEFWILNHDVSLNEKEMCEAKFSQLREKIEPICEECRENSEALSLIAQEITSMAQLKAFTSDKKNQNVEKLSLNFCGQQIGNGGGVFGMFRDGMKAVKNLINNINIQETLKMDLRNNSLNDVSIDYLIEVLEKQKEIISLDLKIDNFSQESGANNFSDKAIYKLCDFMKNLKKLKRFKFSIDSIDELNLKILTIHLEMCFGLERIEVEISKGKVTKEAKQNFSEMRKLNKSVKFCKLEAKSE